jgi:hypothetical protein
MSNTKTATRSTTTTTTTITSIDEAREMRKQKYEAEKAVSTPTSAVTQGLYLLRTPIYHAF